MELPQLLSFKEINGQIYHLTPEIIYLINIQHPMINYYYPIVLISFNSVCSYLIQEIDFHCTPHPSKVAAGGKQTLTLPIVIERQVETCQRNGTGWRHILFSLQVCQEKKSPNSATFILFVCLIWWTQPHLGKWLQKIYQVCVQCAIKIYKYIWPLI